MDVEVILNRSIVLIRGPKGLGIIILIDILSSMLTGAIFSSKVAISIRRHDYRILVITLLY